MLSRRHLRIKALQALYAFFQSQSDSLSLGEKHLLKSTEKLYDLYIYQLSFLSGLMDFAARRIEDARHKFFPTEEDLDPNTRFIDNGFIRQLDLNQDYQKKVENLGISWVDDENLFLRIYNDVKEDPFYDSYMGLTDNSYKADKEMIAAIVKDHLFEDDLMHQYFEDRNIFWAEGDYELSLHMVLRTIYMYKSDWSTGRRLPGLFKDDGAANEDKKFMTGLFRKTIIHSDDYAGLIAKTASNWELERIAIMDVIILKMALAEIFEFPTIPLKVTMNEYIELAKHYSSKKSKIFVNGILDNLVQQLKEENKIKKTGRGLVEK